MGMANGRCITSYDSSRIMTDYLMEKNGVQFQDNYKFRMFLQKNGPDALNLPLPNSACRFPEKGPQVLVERE
jgi:hypothetical protein